MAFGDGRFPYKRKVINQDGGVIFLPDISDFTKFPTVKADPNDAPTSTQKFPLGTKLVIGERVWRYTENGGTGLTAGAPVQSAPAAHAEQDDDIVVAAAAAIGAYTVSLTSTANLDTSPNDEANNFAEGYLVVNDVTGEGHIYKIKSNEGFSGTSNSTFTLYDPIVVALTTSSQVGLIKSPYKDVVVTPGTTPTRPTIGVAPRIVTADYFFWMPTGGPAAVVAHAAIPVGALVVSGLTSGKVDPSAHDATYGLAQTAIPIGWAMTPAIADTESFIVFLTLDR